MTGLKKGPNLLKEMYELCIDGHIAFGSEFGCVRVWIINFGSRSHKVLTSGFSDAKISFKIMNVTSLEPR